MTDPEGQDITQTQDILLKDYHSVIKGKDGEGVKIIHQEKSK